MRSRKCLKGRGKCRWVTGGSESGVLGHRLRVDRGRGGALLNISLFSFLSYRRCWLSRLGAPQGREG